MLACYYHARARTHACDVHKDHTITAEHLICAKMSGGLHLMMVVSLLFYWPDGTDGTSGEGANSCNIQLTATQVVLSGLVIRA